MKRLAILLPIWLVFAIGEPSMVHRCPTHDVAGMLPPAAASHHGAHGSSSPAPTPHSTHGCSCLGACTIVPVAVAPRATLTPSALVVTFEVTIPAARLLDARCDAYRALPYANGPPA